MICFRPIGAVADSVGAISPVELVLGGECGVKRLVVVAGALAKGCFFLNRWRLMRRNSVMRVAWQSFSGEVGLERAGVEGVGVEGVGVLGGVVTLVVVGVVMLVVVAAVAAGAVSGDASKNFESPWCIS